MMNRIVATALAGVALVGAASAADARDGCGGGMHRGPYGHCRPNEGRGPVVVTPGGALIVGNFYPNRGYWDGRRYYQHRDRWHGGWRYR